MNLTRRHPFKRKIKKTGFKKHSRILKIKPGVEGSLKKVFATIGIPDEKPFQPDPFQLEAVAAVTESDCLVTAPTGSGKTWIARQAIDKIWKKGGRSWYASPLKALSNTKYGEFMEIFGADNVGILTGDRKEKPDAPVIVGTTEILRNQLYDAMHHGTTLDTDIVILDEAHFLGDPDRGVVWEEIMIYLPSRIPLLLLSATIGNGDQIAGWLSSIRLKKCTVVKETQRPVPLFPLFFHPSGKLFPLTTMKDSKSKKYRIHKKVSFYMNSKSPPLLSPPRKLPPFGSIIKVLRKYNLLPAIFFLKSRADCDNALDLCLENMGYKPAKKEMRSRQLEELITENPYIIGHRQLWHLEHLAVGAHHSGQLPSWKMVLETLMTKGYLDAVFATSTVAAGVNFPARTIVLLNSDKFNGKEFLPLTPTEFHQMTGRAGRRGMDKIGFAVTVPGRFMDLRLVAKLMMAPPSDVNSRIHIDFSMALNLLLSHTPDQVEELLKKSFAAYTGNTLHKTKKPENYPENRYRKLWRDFLRHLNFLQETGFVDKNGKLTEDGRWASSLRVDQPLIIAEGFRLGIFPDSDPGLFAGIITSLVNEREHNDQKDVFVSDSDNLIRAFRRVKKGLKPFAEHMVRRGFEVRPLFFKPAAGIYAWASGKPWETVLPTTELEEGDLAMLILRTADNLRHIRALSHVFPDAAETASKSIELIMKFPVKMEYEI